MFKAKQPPNAHPPDDDGQNNPWIVGAIFSCKNWRNSFLPKPLLSFSVCNNFAGRNFFWNLCIKWSRFSQRYFQPLIAWIPLQMNIFTSPLVWKIHTHTTHTNPPHPPKQSESSWSETPRRRVFASKRNWKDFHHRSFRWRVLSKKSGWVTCFFLF